LTYSRIALRAAWMSFRFTEIEVGIVMLFVDAISGQDKLDLDHDVERQACDLHGGARRALSRCRAAVTNGQRLIRFHSSATTACQCVIASTLTSAGSIER